MDSISVNFINKTQFELLVKEQIEIAESINKDSKRICEQIKSAYSIKNLTQHRLISIDEGEAKISFINYIEDMFRDIGEDIKLKPITKRTFIDHLHNLDHLINDSYEYQAYSKNEKEIFIEDVKKKLNTIKQDFEKNKCIIENEADNLSKFLDVYQNGNSKRNMMKKIIELSDKYIEPFFNFLQEHNNSNGFISKMRKIEAFFKSINSSEEAWEIHRFIINFKSYDKEIFNIYEKINDYRRKGSEDLQVYNAFEKAFIELQQVSDNLLDGLLTKNVLEGSDFHKKYSLFQSIKVDNFNKANVSIDYKDVVERFERIEETFLIEKDKTNEETKDDINNEKLKTLKKTENLFSVKTRMNSKNTIFISKILEANKNNLMILDKEHDIIGKIHKALSVNMPDYDVFFTIYAYNSIRKRISNVEVGYNKRCYIENNGKIYEYRPVYNLGEN